MELISCSVYCRSKRGREGGEEETKRGVRIWEAVERQKGHEKNLFE